MVKKYIIFLLISLFITIPAFSQTPVKSDMITISRSDLSKMIATEIDKAIDSAVASAIKDTSVRYETMITEYKLQAEKDDKTIKEKNAKIAEIEPMLYNAQQDLKNIKSTNLETVLEVGGVCLAVGTILGILLHNLIK